MRGLNQICLQKFTEIVKIRGLQSDKTNQHIIIITIIFSPPINILRRIKWVYYIKFETFRQR